jgi:quercetin dioxygenase-like cupin family protein
MRRRTYFQRATRLVGAVLLCGSVAVGYTQLKGEAKVWAHEELAWTKDRVLPAVQSALLWGDPQHTEHGMLRRFPAGYAPPPHTHPSVERVVVVSGSIIVKHSKSPEKVLGPGSYSEIPPNVVHAVRCADQSDCEFVLTSSGPFAIVPATGKE